MNKNFSCEGNQRPAVSGEAVLSYEIQDYESPFQTACIDFAREMGYPDAVHSYTYSGDLHSFVPLVAVGDMLHGDDAINAIASGYKYLGVMIGPQGFARVMWQSEKHAHNHSEDLFLRHPAELAEIRTTYLNGKFDFSRSLIPGLVEEKLIDEELFWSPKDKLKYAQFYHDLGRKRIPIHEAPLSSNYKTKYIRVSGAIDDIYLLIEEEPHRGRMVSLSCLKRRSSGAKVKQAIDELLEIFSAEEPFRHFPLWSPVKNVLYPNWWIDDHAWEVSSMEFRKQLSALLNDTDLEMVDISYDDIVVGAGGELVSPQMLGTLCEASKAHLKLVIRLNRKSVSLMRFLDATSHNFDLLGLLGSVSGYEKNFRGRSLLLEAELLDQARASLSFRYAIRRCGDFMAMANYSGLNDLPLDSIERRAQVLADLHTDYVSGGYKKVVSQSSPKLPHFLEISYQRFLAARTQESSFKHGQTVLNLMGKSLLYFMLEDLASAGVDSNVTQSIKDELLKGKPVSDGRLFELQNKLIKSVNEDDLEYLVTSALFESLPAIIRQRFSPLVQARNRAHHAPYDIEGFIDAARYHLTPAIDELRVLFSNLELLVPLHFKTDDEGDYIITAKSLTGHQFEYPDLDYYTDLEPMETPSGALMLCCVAPLQSTPPESHAQSKSLPVTESRSEKPTQKSADRNKRPNSDTERHVISKELSDQHKEILLQLVEADLKFNRSFDKFMSTRIVQAAPLKCFFTKKSGYKEMLMTGIFDRVVKGTPEFEYIEE